MWDIYKKKYMGIGISHFGFVCSFLDAYEKLVGLDFGKKKKKKELHAFTYYTTDNESIKVMGVVEVSWNEVGNNTDRRHIDLSLFLESLVQFCRFLFL